MARSERPSKPSDRGPDQNEPSRKTRIVIEAGRLFGAKGYHGVSMRQIAEAADVQLSLIVYHFSTKENLYRSVFDYFHEIFEARIELLRKITDYSSPDAVRNIIEAFVRPAQKVQSSEEGRIYSLLVLREATDPEQEDRGIIRDYYDPMAEQFIAALARALPHKSRDDIARAYLFAVSSLVMSIFDARLGRLADGSTNAVDADGKYDYLVRFITAGITGA
jgi:AcrR family transcriptional regulator